MKFVNTPAVYLMELGLYPQHSGFGYLAYAIAMVAGDPMSFYSGKVDIFKTMHSEYNVSECCAKRCMQYSIQTAWNVSNNEALHNAFPGSTKDYPPSLYEFICRIAIRLNSAGGVSAFMQADAGAGEQLALNA